MADYNYMSRGGRFSVRAPAPSSTYGKIDDRWPTVGRTEIDETVAMPAMVDADSAMRPGIVVLSPQHKTDAVVTKIETIIEKVYAPSATAYTDGFVVNEEIIENYAAADGSQGKYRTPLSDRTSKKKEFISKVQTEVAGPDRSAVPRVLFQLPTSNNSNTNNGTNDAGPNGWSKSTAGSTKDGANEWNGKATGGITNSTGTSTWTKPAGGVYGANERSRQAGRSATDVGTNGWSNSTGGGNDKRGTGDTGATGRNNDVGRNRFGNLAGGITNDVNPNRLSTLSGGGAGAGAGAGTDTGTNSRSWPIEGNTDDDSPNRRRGLTGGTINAVPTNRPIDVINSTGGTGNWNRQSAGTNNSSSGAWKPMGGTNNTGNDARNWLSGSGAGAGGTDTGATRWNMPVSENESRPTDVINSTGGTSSWNRQSAGTNNSGSGARKPIGGADNTGNDARNWSNGSGAGAGGTTTGATSWNMPVSGTKNSIATNESRPTDVINSSGTNTWNRPSAGANSNGSNTLIKSTSGTNITGNDGRTGTNDSGANWRSRPSVLTIPQQKIDGPFEMNESQLNPSSLVTSATGTKDEYRPNGMGWALPPVYDGYTSRPTSTPGAAFETVKEPPRVPRVPWAEQAQFLPPSVVPAQKLTTIDSNEAARKYSGIATSAPFPRGRVIDSLQAAQKYKGQFITSPPK